MEKDKLRVLVYSVGVCVKMRVNGKPEKKDQFPSEKQKKKFITIIFGTNMQTWKLSSGSKG